MKNNIDDSCGCAMGATFIVAGWLLSSVYYGWQFHANDVSLLSLVLRVCLVTFLAGGAGKGIGILRYRLKGKRIAFLSASVLPHVFPQKGE